MNSSSLEHIKNKKNLEKAKLIRIEVSQLPKKLPEFKKSRVTKDILIANWLKKWIIEDVAANKIKPQQLLPKKEDIAAYIGISTGTIQNAIRYIEDEGLVESKQRIGTMIKDTSSGSTVLRKQSSKRDVAILAIEKLILDSDIKVGEHLPSSREISKIIGTAPNTTRLALEYLSSIGVIKSMGNRGNKANWFLEKMPELSDKIDNFDIKTDTLVKQVERDLIRYIEQNFSVGDRLPAHQELSNILKVSIKTIHDGIRKLIKKGILSARRGRYGTIILKMPNDKTAQKPESLIFAPAQDAMFYNYQKIEQHLKDMIAKEYNVGDKIPSIMELSEKLDVSSNTIRKALQSLGKECIVEFVRGKYGGTYVVNIPKIQEKKPAFTWLSVNKEHIKAYRTVTLN